MASSVILSYARKSIFRNFRRSSTLMIGIIISLAIISGVLFYVDSSTETMIQNSLSDVKIDVTVSQSTVDLEAMNELLNYVENDLSDLVISAELFTNINPYFFRTGGLVASAGDFLLPTSPNIETNFTETYIFGVTPSYFEEFELFETTLSAEQIDGIFSNNEVLVSNDLMTALGPLSVDNSVNVTMIENEITQIEGAGRQTSSEIVQTTEVIVGGTFDMDMEIFQNLVDSFYPEQDEETSVLTSQYANIPNAIIMNYSQFIDLFSDQPSQIASNMVQLNLDHSLLSTDLDELNSQIIDISSKLEVYFPDATVINNLYNGLTLVEDQLNQMKLFLLYFSLPGLLLGAYISKYAIDLNIEERNKEIGLLRTKAAKRKQIATAIAVESSLISGAGMIIGIASGYFLSMTISNVLSTSTEFVLIPINPTSLLMSVVIGVTIAIIASILSTRQLLSPKVIDSVKSMKDDKEAKWKRFKLDFILLGLVVIIYVMNYFQFDIIPGFATAVYDLLAPILTWIGVSLILVRVFNGFLLKVSGLIHGIYKVIFKDLAKLITRNVLFRSKKLTTIAILITLATSFGLTLAIVNTSYQSAAITDAYYTVGGDVRIQFPGSDFIDYNTTDFETDLMLEFSGEIDAYSAIYTSSIRFGRQSITLIGIDPTSFFEVSDMDDYFFASGSIDDAQNTLMATDANGTYNQVILSSSLTNPTETTTTSPGGGSRGSQTTDDTATTTFSIGDTVPLNTAGEVIDVVIGDIANYFPMVADVTGRIEGSVPYAVTNVDFLIDPSSSNVTLLQNQNASIAIFTVNEGVNTVDLSNDIAEWYSLNYQDSSDLIISNIDDEIENYELTLNSLLGLTSMEYIMVLAIVFLGMQIFLASSIFERKKEFGTYFAIGAPEKDIRKILFGEISAISIFSMIAGTLLAFVISSMYLGFLSDLVILEIFRISIPWAEMLILLGLETIGIVLAVFLSSSKLSKLDPANILRVN